MKGREGEKGGREGGREEKEGGREGRREERTEGEKRDREGEKKGEKRGREGREGIVCSHELLNVYPVLNAMHVLLYVLYQV